MAFLLFGSAAISPLVVSHLKSRIATILGLSLVVWGPGFIVAALLTKSLTLFTIGNILGGLGAGLVLGNGIRLVNAVAEPHERASAVSLYFSAGFAGLVTPVIGAGILASSFTALIATAGLAVVVAAFSLGAAILLLRSPKNS